jgi:hypothetical protein
MIGWDEQDWRDFFEERAAILEYDGGYSREAAEDIAALETKILRDSLDSAVSSAVGTEPEGARQRES